MESADEVARRAEIARRAVRVAGGGDLRDRRAVLKNALARLLDLPEERDARGVQAQTAYSILLRFGDGLRPPEDESRVTAWTWVRAIREPGAPTRILTVEIGDAVATVDGLAGVLDALEAVDAPHLLSADAFYFPSWTELPEREPREDDAARFAALVGSRDPEGLAALAGQVMRVFGGDPMVGQPPYGREVMLERAVNPAADVTVRQWHDGTVEWTVYDGVRRHSSSDGADLADLVRGVDLVPWRWKYTRHTNLYAMPSGVARRALFWDESREEFVRKTWAPSRHVDWCLDIDERRTLAVST